MKIREGDSSSLLTNKIHTTVLVRNRMLMSSYFMLLENKATTRTVLATKATITHPPLLSPGGTSRPGKPSVCVLGSFSLPQETSEEPLKADFPIPSSFPQFTQMQTWSANNNDNNLLPPREPPGEVPAPALQQRGCEQGSLRLSTENKRQAWILQKLKLFFPHQWLARYTSPSELQMIYKNISFTSAEKSTPFLFDWR